MNTPASLARPSEARVGHFVRLFDDDDFLLNEVVDFLQDAVRTGGTGLVIATTAHRQELEARWPGLAAPGACVVLDAEETLATFMVDGWPDADRFHRSVGGLVAEAVARGVPVHAFGEMVAVLCAAGHYEAAVRLEALWNELSGILAFHLFCAYPAALFDAPERGAALRRVCSAHQHVCRSERVSNARSPEQLQRLLNLWERKAADLEAEVDRRRTAEEALRQRERELEDFVENAAEGLHRVSGDGTILWANRAELALLGYTADEYVGRSIIDFHLDRPVIDAILQKLSAGETVLDQPARLRCKDGSVKHVLIHSNGFFENGRLAYTRCFTRDATDRLARERAHLQLQSTLINAPVATALLAGPEFRFEWANRHFHALVGHHDLTGHPLENALADWDTAGLRRCLGQVHATGTACVEEDFRAERRRPDGDADERFFRLSLQPRHAADGTVDAVIVVVVDQTEAVRSRQATERNLADRERLLAQLRDADHAKDEFLAMLGHELRNPLAPIVTALKVLRRRQVAGIEREQAIVERQVSHLARLVDDLLDVSRITRGRIELQRGPVSLQDVAARALEMAEPALELRKPRLNVQVDRDIWLHADAVRLAQVVSNLLNNAGRYTDEGGEITLHAGRHPDGGVEIHVRDNGIGMPAHVMSHVFDTFYQGERSVARSEGGLGIGLALVRRLVELHGGQVSASSPGRGLGSQFTVLLPADATLAAPAPATAPTASPAAGAGRLRILVVDDNVDGGEMLAELLTSAGHDVLLSHDPLDALRAVERFPADLAILDIGLPGMDGHALVSELRNRPTFASCCFVALTGYGQAADRARSLAAGFRHHFVKPVDPAQLLDFVEAQASARDHG